jgi:hypothetical protein
VKHCHEIGLGQWPPRMYLIADKRTYNRFMRDKQGPDFRPFPPRNGGSCEMMKQERTGSCIFVIAVGPQDGRDELAATLAHEATHAMRWILEYAMEQQAGTEGSGSL